MQCRAFYAELEALRKGLFEPDVAKRARRARAPLRNSAAHCG
jgi:hypothetical protein